MKREAIFLVSFLGVISAGGIGALAQTSSYHQTNLVSDMAGSAAHVDRTLVNPWGIAFSSGGPFWIANNNSGFATVYDSTGAQQIPVAIGIPAPTHTNTSTPTGVVSNPFAQDGDFQVAEIPSQFLFATEDGTISGWGTDNRGDFPVSAAIAINHSLGGAVYKGLAIVAPACCREFLIVANFHSGLIEPYTTDFVPLAPPGSFTDPNLPAGYAPFGIQVIGNQVFVTYAVQDTAKHDPVIAAGNGLVDIFDLEGNFVKRFASNGPLNAPWGVAQASANFGAFSNDILIGNFGDGTINAFDSATGNFLGTLKDGTGAAITNSGLWGLVFGAGGTGDPDTLYFTAGLAGEAHGLFGAITVGSATAAPDFSISPFPPSATVTAGQSATFMLAVASTDGFSGNVTFSCTAPTGVTCAFDPPTVMANAGGASTTLTATTSASVMNYSRGASHPVIGMLFTGIGVFGCFVFSTKQKRKRTLSTMAGMAICVAALATLTMSTACGGYSSHANRGTAAVVVTATSGTLSHTTTVNLTVQ